LQYEECSLAGFYDLEVPENFWIMKKILSFRFKYILTLSILVDEPTMLRDHFDIKLIKRKKLKIIYLIISDTIRKIKKKKIKIWEKLLRQHLILTL